MFWIGLTVVSLLTLLAFFAALAVCMRARFAGRSELACGVAVAWSALVLAPIYGLGFTRSLTATSLGITSMVVSAATLAIAGRGIWQELPRAAWGLLRMPFDGLRVTWRARSFAFLGVAFAIGIIAWTILCSYFLPSWRDWDALWYHEPIVGFTIQNHGLGIVSLPPGGIQKINGYPKVAEMIALWFVIFTDRRLIDLSSCLVAPFLVLAVYALARRYTDGPVTAMGWATALLLAPAATRELQSLYVDLNYAWALLATTYFATRPVMRVRDALFCAVAATLAVGTKGHALAPVPLLLLIALARLIRQNPGRWRAVAGTALFGATLVLAMVGSIYLRNYLAFHNPLWPDVKIDIDKWNVHFPGEYAPGERVSGREGLDMNEPWGQFFEDAMSSPYSWHRWHYGEIHDYGLGVPWVVWPLAACAFVAMAVALSRSALGRVLGLPRWRAAAETMNAAWLAIPIFVIIGLSPARWAARYQMGPTALLVVVCAWVSGRRGFARLGEGASAIAILGGIASNYWSSRWWVWPDELATIVHIPYPEREMTTAPRFTTAYITTGACVTKDTGLARERELKKGDVLVFPNSYGNFPALFWNDKFTNKVVWVPEGNDFIVNAEKENPTWIYVTFGDPNYSRLKAAGSAWEEVGPLNVEGWGATFRRKK